METEDIVLAAVDLKGSHTGEDMSAYVLKISESTQKYIAGPRPSNRTLGLELGSKLQHFESEEDGLGCIGHVINSAAKAGLKTLRKSITNQ